MNIRYDLSEDQRHGACTNRCSWVGITNAREKEPACMPAIIYALPAFLTAFLTTSLRAFLASITSNLPKSFKFLLFSTFALFCAHELLSHFSTVPSFSRNFLTMPDEAARGSFEREKGVRVRCL